MEAAPVKKGACHEAQTQEADAEPRDPEHYGRDLPVDRGRGGDAGLYTLGVLELLHRHVLLRLLLTR